MLKAMKITTYRNDLYQHKFYAHSAYYKFIIGSCGETIKQLSKDNKVDIRILGDESQILICGDEKENIISARQEIDQLMSSFKKKLRFTHFISIPTNSDEIRLNFKNFKESVLRQNNAPGLKEGMFVEDGTLHLTVTMLLLLEIEDQEQATKAIHECKKHIISSIIASREPLTLTLQGVNCMESNPAKAKFLYIQVHENTGYLQEMCDKIFDYYLKKGLTRIERNRKNVRLHVTAIKSSNLLKSKNSKFVTFDATNILNEHKNTYFGKMLVSNLHLSQIGTRDENGYYESKTIVDLTNF